jgi:hypothetical protein
MKCPACGEWFDMRDLAQVLAHVHDAEIDIAKRDLSRAQKVGVKSNILRLKRHRRRLANPINRGFSTMQKPYLRLYHRHHDGKIVDAGHDMTLSDFAGVLPSIGDWILQPGVRQGLDQLDPKSRNIWVVVHRMFNPRDMENGIALIVENRKPTPNELDLLPSG